MKCDDILSDFALYCGYHVCVLLKCNFPTIIVMLKFTNFLVFFFSCIDYNHVFPEHYYTYFINYVKFIVLK